MARFSSSNFIKTPTAEDIFIRIYDSTGTWVFDIDPWKSEFINKGTYVYVIVDNIQQYNLKMDFSASSEAETALSLINDVKSYFLRRSGYQLSDYALLTQVYTTAQTYNTGQTYSSVQINELFNYYSTTSHTHAFSGLTGINVTSATDGQYLQYTGGTWINATVSFDLSNYYTKTQVYNTGETYSSAYIDNLFEGVYKLNLSGQSNKYVIVNTSETGLTFTNSVSTTFTDVVTGLEYNMVLSGGTLVFIQI